MSRARLVVLVSGGGTNLQALLDACQEGRLNADVELVVSNRRKAFGLERARRAKVEARYLGYRKGDDRASYDASLADLVASARPDVVVLAGWMHILGRTFLDRVPAPVLNLHPALPGQFPGLDAIARAWEAARRGELLQTGVMVHHAVAEVDAGPVVASATVAIDPSASLAVLEEAIHEAEHRLIVEAVAVVLDEQRQASTHHSRGISP